MQKKLISGSLAKRAGFLLGLAAGVGCALGNPRGATVGRGTVGISQNGPRLTIQASQNSFINWSSFNIAAGETTTFIQPGPRSVVWNRINDQNPSQILGTLNANGFVVLMNQNGFYFGRDSVINVGGFLVSAAPVVQSNFGDTSFFQFGNPPPNASIINYGHINVGRGGDAFLVAEKVENNGTITAPDGTIGLYAGKEVLISERPDGRGISARVRLPEGSVDNNGKLIADGGTIALHAQVVNQNGLIQANSVRERNGVIELDATENIELGSASQLVARGGSEGPSNGGHITVRSQGSFADQAGSSIDISGGDQAGNGGLAEISAPRINAIRSMIFSLTAPNYIGGRLLIDPTDVVLQNGSTPGSNPDALYLDVNSSYVGLSQITVQADRDISLAPGTRWNLNDSTGISDPGSLLTLEAGRNINFGNGSAILGGGGWSVAMNAGGGIYFNGGNGSVQTADGSINLRAGSEMVLGSGSIVTTGGGDIRISTQTGSVNAGANASSFDFTRNGPVPSANGVGGIATLNGGNISIDSGKDILSILPTIGCYGKGDLTLSAQGSILGRYLVSHGNGVLSGFDIGSDGNPISLELADGSWDVRARHDIILNEVFNPNGSLNPNRQLTGARIPFQFDYAPDASVSLTAGNAVELLGSSPAHTDRNPDRLPIYPPRLNIQAGAGGLLLGNDVILYPSAMSSLRINILDGGSFSSLNGSSHRLVMSDSDSPDYTTFADGHSAIPLQLPFASDPAIVNVSGNVENVQLQIPKKTLINVGGNTMNFFFTGQNLQPGDVSQINVGGSIRNQTDLSSIVLSKAPDLSIFDPSRTSRSDLGLNDRLSYNRLTHELTFQGRMTTEQLQFLLNPTVGEVDGYGHPVVDRNGQQIYVPAHFLNATLITQLYAETQDVPTFPTKNGGFMMGGPGQLSISADNMDLGVTAGIRSMMTGLNPDLAFRFSQGADLNINLRDNLDMVSSQIASFNGGSISVQAGGTMNIGSQTQFTSDDTPKGIYTGKGGSVSVVANGDVVVNGARIATYDGGDLTVTSVHGNVDAGRGGLGFFTISSPEVDPKTGDLSLQNDRFFGSGIMTVTSVGSHARVGNITINAGQDILANSGGVLQMAFNAGGGEGATVNLGAQRDIQADNSGILGVSVSAHAAGAVKGLIVAQENIDISAGKSVSVVAVASGGINISSGGAVSGLVVGGGDVAVAGDSITANVMSTGGTAEANGAQSSGVFQGVAGPAAQKTTDEAAETATKTEEANLAKDDTEEQKKGKKRPVLAKSTGRVTVIMKN